MLVVDHNVVWLHISVHDAHTVAVVESPEELVEVEPNLQVGQLLVEKLVRGEREGR